MSYLKRVEAGGPVVRMDGGLDAEGSLVDPRTGAFNLLNDHAVCV